ncbi:class I SAM-dependent DNA methyltransferase [Veillonella caviae]|uniref:HsdM family class I SAM-dependent methyltransferase n=1 Tax=Veillonella caviae TaxID=248316 RepID=UPI0023F826BD|nr:N-6 DNA methylase [Veillonella caviae]MCI7694304.1 N-6 DNA methylase [Veillonella caviae]MDY5253392.1 N-6 DNA methylase [Veillonella caviae]
MIRLSQQIEQYLKDKNIVLSKENRAWFESQIIRIESLLDDNSNILMESRDFPSSVIELAYLQGRRFTNIEKKSHGIYFTPIVVAKRMAKLLVEEWGKDRVPYIVDPAMGSGVLLLAIVVEVAKKYNISYKDVIENYIFGIDIRPENVELAKLFLGLLCFEQDGMIPESNLLTRNSLDFREDHVESFFKNKFDAIISNPPYVSARNMSEEMKADVAKFVRTKHGTPDLYIPFFEIAINLLVDNGVAVYITPNSYFKSLNGKKVRAFLRANTSWIKLIDYDSDQIFSEALHYFAITIFQKKEDSLMNSIYYLNKKKSRWDEIYPTNNWITIASDEQEIINKLEHRFMTNLGDLEFRNGIATQRNNIYMFEPIKEERDYYYFFYKGNQWKIEKEITRPFVLPNLSKQKRMRIIFPYTFFVKERLVTPIPPTIFAFKYPFAYQYLLHNREELEARKHDKDMEFWYLYGRKQGLKQFGKRLYLPYMANMVRTFLSKSEDEVFAAGYAIFSESEQYLELLAKILESKLFAFYLRKVSKPYEAGYYSTAKNMIRRFSIPHENEISKLILNDADVCQLYELGEEEIRLIDC